MKKYAAFSMSGKGADGADPAGTKPSDPKAPSGPPADGSAPKADGACCRIDIRIKANGDVNIYNCSPAGGGKGDACGDAPPPSACPPCADPKGACLPVVPGAKHKLSRDHKLASLAQGIHVPSALAASTVHLMRRFLAGKTPSGTLETQSFAIMSKMSRELLACAVSAGDAVPPRQRGGLFAPSLQLGIDQPMDNATLSAALAQELLQRVGLGVFGDADGADEERPGLVRLYVPQGEDFFTQVRICRINDLRTANYYPPLNPGDYLPAEIQQDCAAQIVNGQAQVVCQVRTANCPGNTVANVCGRVLDIAQGDGVVLQGVNYFNVDAKVRFSSRETGATLREVDAHVWGDVDTPVNEDVGGQTRLVNDCRVHDRITFAVPTDLSPNTYAIQVVVPNNTGIAAFGTEMVSNVEFINVIPTPNARFQVVTESILARQETSPDWLGSDEVGLHTLAMAMDMNLQPAGELQEQTFEDIQDVDFDSGTRRVITRKVFEHNQPILGMVLVVLGDEIDSQHYYDDQLTSQTKYFLDLIKVQALALAGAVTALKAAGVTLASLGAIGAWTAGIGLVVLIGIDIVIALWAPADPIIRDSIALSITDLTRLTSADFPSPDPSSYTADHGIVVNINKTVPPVKIPLEYHETREYVCSDQDSRYEVTYRFNRIA